MRNRLVEKILSHVSDDLRRDKYKGHPNNVAGHCYVVCETMYYLDPGKWLPVFIRHEGEPHWFLKHHETGKVLDPTASQFKSAVQYHLGVRKGFLTNKPSKRCLELMIRVLNDEK